MTEVDELSGRVIHDEIARLLVEYIQTQPLEENRKFLNVIPLQESVDYNIAV